MSRPPSRPLWRIFRVGLLPSTKCYFLWLKCKCVGRGASCATSPGGKVGGEMSISSGLFIFSAVNEFQIIKPKKKEEGNSVNS